MIKTTNQNKDIGVKKVCSRCKETKSTIHFNKDLKSKDTFKASCKKCISAYNKEYNKNNNIKRRKHAKEWKEENKERVNKYMLSYIDKNKQTIYKKSTEYHKKRYNSDPVFKLRRLLRDRIYKTLTTERITFKTKELLGCDFQYLKSYLSFQFTSKMSWENHGTYWEIDHILPCSSFDLTDIEQQKQCFHYTNLQPLTKKDNRMKSNKIFKTNV